MRLPTPGRKMVFAFAYNKSWVLIQILISLKFFTTVLPVFECIEAYYEASNPKSFLNLKIETSGIQASYPLKIKFLQGDYDEGIATFMVSMKAFIGLETRGSAGANSIRQFVVVKQLSIKFKFINGWAFLINRSGKLKSL
jgi:hypothetical protein